MGRDRSTDRTAPRRGGAMFRTCAPVREMKELLLLAEDAQLQVRELARREMPRDLERALVFALLQLSLLVERARLGALELTARGLRDGARIDHHHLVDREPGGLRDPRLDPARERVAPLAQLRLRDHDHRLTAEARLMAREGDDVSLAHAFHLGARPLEILRIIVLPVDDDDVLRAAADEDVAVDEVSEIAGAQPPVRADCLTGFFRHLEVALHHARAAHFDLTDSPI